ncbi:MAG: SpoIIE family protein phosphatase [Bacteroidetes bacterium]|nr:SpoIIE family protein phosphatase [Bacteroidota bacterium]
MKTRAAVHLSGDELKYLTEFFKNSPRVVRILFIVWAVGFSNLYFDSVSRAVKTVTDENVFSGKDSLVTVTSVSAGGASDRAGMKRGDLIFSINGKRFKGELEADAILRSAKPGSVMEYEVIRDGQKLILYVQAATIGVSVRTIASALTFLAMMILALFVAWKVPSNPLAWLFSAAIIFMAVPVSAAFMVERASLQNLSAQMVFAGLPLMFHLGLLFPEQHPQYDQKRKHLKLFYLISAIFLVSFTALIQMLINGARIPDSGLYLQILIAGFLIFMFTYSVIFFRKSGKSRPGRVINWIWGVYGTVIFTTIFLTFLGYSWFNNLLFLLLVVPLGYFYLILRFRVFGITRIMKRNVQYYSLMFLLIMGLVFTFFSLTNLVTQINLGDAGFRFTPTALEIKAGGARTPGFSERPFFILAGIGVFILLYLTGRFLQRRLARFFSKDDIDYRLALAEISEVMASRLNLADLGQALSEELVQHLRLKSAVIMVRAADGYRLTGESGIQDFPGGELNHPECFPELAGLQSPVPSDKLVCRPLLKSAGIQFVSPLQLKEKQAGLIFLGPKRSEEMYNVTDIQFVESLSRQIAVAVENTRLAEETLENERLKQELDLARKIQRSLLPATIPQVRNLDISGTYEPASQVGGDYYDFLMTEPDDPASTLTVVLGDVAGKGVSAALMAARIQGIMNSANRSGLSTLKDLLIHANTLTTLDDRKNFITLVAGQFDPAGRKITVCRAGHLPILHFKSAENRVDRHLPGGIAMGISRTGRFPGYLQELSFPFQPGDIWVFFSDGLSEAMNEAGDEFGAARIESLIQNHQNQSAAEISKEIFAGLKAFTGLAPAHDDMTLVVVKVTG